MILLTVGTQLPFNRFVQMVDAIAPSLRVPIFAQIGSGTFEPRNMEWRRVVGPIEFEQMVQQSIRIVSHAGIGTVVMAQKHLKPLILFPRLGVLDEHRNDHQLATIRALSGRKGVYIAQNEDELATWLRQEVLALPTPENENPERERLRHAVAGFIESTRAKRRG